MQMSSSWVARNPVSENIATAVSKVSELAGRWIRSDADKANIYDLVAKIRNLEGVEKVQVIYQNEPLGTELLIVGNAKVSIYNKISSLIVDFEEENRKMVSYIYRKPEDCENNG